MPDSLRAEHEELRADVEQAMRIEGRIGEAARSLESLVRLHFRKEDDNVLLPLGLLQGVAEGKIAPAMHEVVVMVDRLEAELPEMLAEHGEIQRALGRLGKAATEERAGRESPISPPSCCDMPAWKKKCCILPPSCWASISSRGCRRVERRPGGKSHD